jgi:hypothetical protein
MNINRQTLQVIQNDVLDALKDVETKHNLKFKFGRGTYDRLGRFANLKLEVSAVGEDGKVEDQEGLTFKTLAPRYGLKPEHLGAKFIDRGEQFEIIGLVPRRHKNPITVRRIKNDKTYIFPADIVLRALGLPVPQYI